MPTKARGFRDLLPKPTPKPRAKTAERGYGSAWQRFARQYLTENPVCVVCIENGKTTAATEVDHVIPHKGNRAAFWRGPFQGLCKPCHSRKTAKELHHFG